MKLLQFLSGGIIKDVKETLDDNIYSKEERAADSLKAQEMADALQLKREEVDHDEFLKQLDVYLEEQKVALENTKDARAREIAINNSEHSSWLQRNIMPLIATFILISTVVMNLLLIFKKSTIVAVDMVVVGGIIDTFKTLSTLVVGYYFGSSMGSKVKDDLLNKKK